METRKEKIIKFKGNISQAVADDRISSSCACQIMDEFDAILALPIEVPSIEDVENKYPEDGTYANMNSRISANWAIVETIKLNKI